MDSSQSFPIPARRWQVIAFWLLMALGVVAFIELTSFIAERVTLGAPGAENPVRPRVERQIPDWLVHRVLHPYAGYYSPRKSRAPVRFGQSGPAESFRVALLGGSVAVQVEPALTAAMAHKLKDMGIERPLQLELFASGGTKQPQQLMHLAYALALGKRYDLVVNLDGYNEAVLPFTENLPLGISPTYPRRWDVLVGAITTTGQGRLLAQIDLLVERRKAMETFRLDHWASASATVRLVVRLVDRSVAAKITDLNAVIAADSGTLDPQLAGPVQAFEHGGYRKLVEVWRQSSAAIAALAASEGARYFHFLQPNQHVRSKKPMSTDERAVAFGGNPGHRAAVRKHLELTYPTMIRVMAESATVYFHDLTAVFDDEATPIYIDACCHVNQLGTRRLSEAMVGLIARDWAAPHQPQSGSPLPE